MKVKYGPAKRIPPGLWAKAGIDETGAWHILMAEVKEHIKDTNSVGHDHYWKRDGKWYVQIRSSKDAMLVQDKKGHCLPHNTPFDICRPDILDNLLRQLIGDAQ